MSLKFSYINNNLTGKLPETIEGFSVGADGKPYITYKVGADSVTKKLGNNFEDITLITGKGYYGNINGFSASFTLTEGEYLVSCAMMVASDGAVFPSRVDQVWLNASKTVTSGCEIANLANMRASYIKIPASGGTYNFYYGAGSWGGAEQICLNVYQLN